MHYKLLVKIRANSAEDALSEARSQVEDSTGEGKPFDYMSDEVVAVTPKVLKEFKAKTAEELGKRWKGFTDRNIKEQKACLKDTIFIELARRYLSREDAPSYAGYKNHYGNADEGVEKIVKQVQTAKRSKPKLPTRLDDLAGAIVELLRPSAQPFPMGPYYLKHLDKLYDCKRYPNETSYTLYCYDCHFANLGGTGKRAYYFFFDRHS